MTEAEAKQKWCPFARVGILTVNGGVTVNRPIGVPSERSEVSEGTRCIASGCMAWEWYVWPQQAAAESPSTEPAGVCGLAQRVGP
jgi:hypothetical protein